MSSRQKTILLIIIFAIVIGGGFLFYINQPRNQEVEQQQEEEQKVIDSDSEEEMISIVLHFQNFGISKGQIPCDETIAVARMIPQTQGVVRASLTELIKGPTDEEKNAGYFTIIDEETVIHSISIEEGVAVIDLSEAAQKPITNTCVAASIRAQISNTATQFSMIDEVRIFINGEENDILNPQ